MQGAVVVALCVMLVSLIDGCTAIGFAVGAGADARAGRGGPELLLKLPVGREVTLDLHDGRRLEGRFLGWARDSAATLAAAESLPVPRERVKLATRSGEVTIDADQIARVSVSVSSGKVRGLMIGAAVDIVAISVFFYAIEQMVASAGGQ